MASIANKKQKQELQHPNWVFTVQYGGPNQLTEEDAGVLVQGLQKYCSYLVVGRETAPTTGQLHLQGYCELLKPRRRTELVKVIQCFWDPAKGSAAQNYEYCTKGGDFMEVGEAKEQDPGKREQDRWDLARSQAESGERVEDSQIVICHYASLRLLQRDHMVMPPDLTDVCGVWLYGIAGAGKSRKARQDYPGAYLKMCNKWWDGYQNQPFVIIDDFDSSHACLGHHLKIWADRYAFSMEVKGGSYAIRPKVICVTSQYAIDDIWTDSETRDALHRRFQSLRIGPPGDTPPAMKRMFLSQPVEDTDDEDDQPIPSQHLARLKQTKTTSSSSTLPLTNDVMEMGEGNTTTTVFDTQPTTGKLKMFVLDNDLEPGRHSASPQTPLVNPDVQHGLQLKRAKRIDG